MKWAKPDLLRRNLEGCIIPPYMVGVTVQLGASASCASKGLERGVDLWGFGSSSGRGFVAAVTHPRTLEAEVGVNLIAHSGARTLLAWGEPFTEFIGCFLSSESVLLICITAELHGDDAFMISSAEWWYESRGSRVGPVPVQQIETLLKTGAIGQESLVWTSGMPSWAPVAQTQLAAFCSSPPPLTATAVNDTLVWWLSWAPIWAGLIGGFVAAALGITPYLQTLPVLAVNIWLCSIDEKRLQRAGYQTKQLGSAILVPVYLFRRAAMLRRGSAYGYVWIVALIIGLTIP